MDTVLVDVLQSLANDRPFDRRHRDCHIGPDLILIYRKYGEDVLQLVRLGSHNELGL